MCATFQSNVCDTSIQRRLFVIGGLTGNTRGVAVYQSLAKQSGKEIPNGASDVREKLYDAAKEAGGGLADAS